MVFLVVVLCIIIISATLFTLLFTDSTSDSTSDSGEVVNLDDVNHIITLAVYSKAFTFSRLGQDIVFSRVFNTFDNISHKGSKLVNSSKYVYRFYNKYEDEVDVLNINEMVPENSISYKIHPDFSIYVPKNCIVKLEKNLYEGGSVVGQRYLLYVMNL